MTGVADPELDRARAVRAFLRAHRRRRHLSAYHMYVAALTTAVVGGLGEHALASLVGGGLAAAQVAMLGPAVIALVLVTMARFGTWQGPVTFSAPDVCLVLAAPLAAAELVRPKLDHGLAAGALAGAAVGVVAVLVTAGGVGSLGAARAAGAVAALAGAGALAVAGSWLVQSSRRAAAWVHRAGPPALLVPAALLVGLAGGGGRAVVGWSGPWGWALAPLDGRAGWPVGLALTVTYAAAAVVWARRRAATVDLEGLLDRARTRAGLGTAAFTLNYRGAALTYRAALPARARSRLRVPRPRRSGRAILWRDALGLTRDPSRVGWAALLGAASTVEALTHPGRVLPAGLAAVALYGAAALLCEPLRVDVDAPDRGAVLVSWPFARLLLAHCALPAIVLGAVDAATVAATVLAGAAGPGALLLIPTMLAPIVAVVVLCMALAARRGGRIDADLLSRLLSVDPSTPVGPALGVVWLAPWLLVAIGVGGAAIALLGAAAAGHHAVLGAGVAAGAIACAATVALIGVARRSRRPEA